MVKLVESKIRKFDMTPLANRVSGRARDRFLVETGEHYRLLAYLSEKQAGGIFYDVGTLSGASAVALASHPNSCVTSWDIDDGPRKRDEFAWPGTCFENIEWRKGDIFDEPSHIYYIADIICLDISPHDGIQEQRFTDILDDSGFDGILICDDIQNRRFPGMKKWWDKIDRPKQLVPYAHCSGTGIVSYK
jgi:hypothetical protein